MSKPGTYFVVLTAPDRSDEIAFKARMDGLEVRDCYSIQTPSGPLTGFLFRKPMDSTVLKQTLRGGTGTLDIDAGRIGTSDNLNGGAYAKSTGHPTKRRWEGGPLTITGEKYKQPEGRFPSNFLLVHGSGCEQVGTKKVAANPSSVYWTSSGHNAWPGEDTERSTAGYASEDGTEKVADWNCQPNCPVRLLDLQSGKVTSGSGMRHNNISIGGGRVYGGADSFISEGYDDNGGASRFFYQATSLDEIKSYIETLTNTDTEEKT